MIDYLPEKLQEKSIVLSRLDELCKKNEDNFLWVDAIHFYSNINKNILFTVSMWASIKDNFSIDARSTFVSNSRVSYFNFDYHINSQILLSLPELVIEMKKNKLVKGGYVPPEINYDNQSLKKGKRTNNHIY